MLPQRSETGAASPFAPPMPAAPAERLIWAGLPGSSRSLAIVEAAPGPIVNRDMNMVLGPRKGTGKEASSAAT